jgi:hypothetical protein
MTFDATFEAGGLRRALGVLAGLVPNQTTLNIYRMACLVVRDGFPASAYLAVRTGEVYGRVPVTLVGHPEPGRCLVPLKLLGRILASVRKDGEPVRLAYHQPPPPPPAAAGRKKKDEPAPQPAPPPALRVKAGAMTLDAAWEDPGTFSEPADDPTPGWTMAAADLAATVRAVEGFCDIQSTRYALGGMPLRAEPGRARLEATDGRRAAVAWRPATPPGGSSADAHLTAGPVIPRRSWIAVADLCGLQAKDAEAEVGYAAGGESLIARFPDGSLFRARALDGRWPDFQSVWPSNPAALAVAYPDGAELQRAVALAAIAAGPNQPGVEVEAVAPDRLMVWAEEPDVGRAIIAHFLPAGGGTVDRHLAVCLDASLFAGLLRPAVAGPFRLELRGERDPVVIEADGYRACMAAAITERPMRYAPPAGPAALAAATTEPLAAG